MLKHKVNLQLETNEPAFRIFSQVYEEIMHLTWKMKVLNNQISQASRYTEIFFI